MRNGSGRLAAAVRVAGALAVALAIATPASAQLGGLKKKLKAAAAPEAPAAAAPAGGAGGTIVLTEDVVERLIAGLKAAEAEREAADKEDTPHARYRQALTRYEAAKPKCVAAQQTFANRMAGNEKMMEKYSALIDKMVAAQTRGDQRLTTVYSDSAMAMQDPSCTIKQPEQPDNYYEAQREIDERSEQKAMEKSEFSRSELSQVRERAEAVLRGGDAPGDLSASEKSAVSTHASELKQLLGIQDAPPPAPTQAAAAPPPPAPAPVAPAASSASSDMGSCVAKNAQKHENEIRALGERAQAAQQAGNTAALMAIADTLQRLQMAGCQ
jgi:hypothetical protein